MAFVKKKTPKQLLNLSGKDCLVNEAIDRIANVIEKDNIFIITSEEQSTSVTVIRATDGHINKSNIIAEPEARNTTACIGYAAMYIMKKYGDGVMVVVPSDHFIKNTDALVGTLKLAMVAAEETGKIITIGIKPTFPSTGFGYIKYAGSEKIKQVHRFVEKPNVEKAQEYYTSTDYAWNSGMFIWKASVIIEKIKKYVPDIFMELEKIAAAMNTSMEQDELHRIYRNIFNVSIDYSVMEPCAEDGDILLIPCEYGWNDIGSWDMMEILHEQDINGNTFIGDITAVDTKNTIIYSSGRTVTAVDVEDLIIVETADAVMVCKKEKAQDVRKIVQELELSKRVDLL